MAGHEILLRCRARRGLVIAVVATVIAATAGLDGAGQLPDRAVSGTEPPASPRSIAPYDLTGYWVSVVTEDWQWRMVTPPKGDYSSIPINAEGRRVADTWDAAKDGSCAAYGAAALLRQPGRLHIRWQDSKTLKIETDAGLQTRYLHFDSSVRPSGRRSLQGHSKAEWSTVAGDGPCGFDGIGPCTPAPNPSRGSPWRPLKITTTELRGGWLRKNGVPYSENAVVTEYFMPFRVGENDEWFTVTTVVDDPTYLTQPFITSTNFRREPTGAKWRPRSCVAR
jgi:hypothetical protein